MAEQFLTLMAVLDDESQERMSGWYKTLQSAGFSGTQTPGLPYHISLASYPTDNERMALELAEKAAEKFTPVPVHISHIGIFPGGRVLFGAPERNPALDALHDFCETDPSPERPWTPHATILIDEPGNVCAALPHLVKCFQPFVGRITRLHLCAFRPTREIADIGLRSDM